MVTTFPVRSVTVHWRSSLKTMSSQTPPVVEPTDEEVSELGASSASGVTPRHKTNLEDMKTVWDFEKIEKRGGPDLATRCWYCGWCNSTFLGGWNATKAMLHCGRVAGNNDVKFCVGPIPIDTLAIFRGFRMRKISTKGVKRKKGEAYQNAVAENQKSIAVAFEEGRLQNSASSGAGKNVIDMTFGNGDVAISNSSQLTTAIAEYVYCKGLSFSAVQGEEFQQIIKLSRLVPSLYRPPTRNVLANELLDTSYQS